MIKIVDVDTERTLDDFAAHASLQRPVEDLRAVAEQYADRLEDRTVWMVNSTAQGGGVAEMLPMVVSILRDLGVSTEWAVIVSEKERFFRLTKHIHNLIHGSGDPHLSDEDHALYRSVSENMAEGLARRVEPGDPVVVHDPQPLGTGALLKEKMDIPALWRCHIGLDESNAATETAWEFLKPWVQRYDETIFSLREYLPDFLEDRSDLIQPALNPLSPKNRTLSITELTNILRRSRLAGSSHPSVEGDFTPPAQRLQRDGSFAPATRPQDFGLMERPIVTQISRWDKLKGFAPLLQGFARMKTPSFLERTTTSDRERRRIALSRLVLAGPDPESVSDDPEGQKVFIEICSLWHDLPPEIQRDVAIITLPMTSRRVNSLMVNALQRCSTIIAQNSLREGFGLTVTEAMWKRRPVMGTHAAGLREQVKDGVHGRRTPRAEDPEAVALTLHEMLNAEEERRTWARNARRRVSERYLVFTQVRRWLEILAQTVDRQEAVTIDGTSAA
ncbi:MAG: glycosyltransferase [Salinibacter sp.]